MRAKLDRWTTGAPLAAVVALTAATGAGAATIGVDARNGYNASRVLATGDMFETFRATIEGEGHVLVALTSFTSDQLSGLDALILGQPSVGDGSSANFSTAELADVHAFVEAGGSLLVHGEGGGNTNYSVANLNALVAPYGVTYAAAATAGSGLAVPPSAYMTPHALVEGLDDPIGMDFVRPLQSISTPATNLFSGLDTLEQYMAFVDNEGQSAGNVVMLTDVSLWTDAGEGSDADIMQFYPGGPVPVDNLQLLQNIVAFLAPPAPPAEEPAPAPEDPGEPSDPGAPEPPAPDPGVPGDVNGDGSVDGRDLVMLLAAWGACPAPPDACPADLTGDGMVDAMDLLDVLRNWDRPAGHRSAARGSSRGVGRRR